MTLLEMSLTGGILILAIMVIRFFTINRLPKRVFLLLWEIAIFKLLIPFSIPSIFSIYTLFKPKQSVKLPNVPETVFIPTADLPTPITTPMPIQETFSIPIWKIIWFIGMVLCFVGFISAYIICYRRFRYATITKNAFILKWIREQNLKRNVKVCLSDTIFSPLTYGLFKPVILLPTTIDRTPINQLIHILTHEMVHIKRFDTIRKIIIGITLCVHWFNPMVWVLYILFNRDIELVCDEAVIHTTDNDCRSTYAMTLITMEEKKNEGFSLYSYFGKNAIEERIVAIMKFKKFNLLTAGVACALVFGVTSVFATSATDTEQYTITSSNNEETPQDIAVSLKDGDEIEWWTYEAYKEWLEQEKQNLQKIIGTRMIDTKETSKYDDFIWTQEKVDETIARYEKNLEAIKNGAKLSKPMANGDVVYTQIYDDANEMLTMVEVPTVSYMIKEVTDNLAIEGEDQSVTVSIVSPDGTNAIKEYTLIKDTNDLIVQYAEETAISDITDNLEIHMAGDNLVETTTASEAIHMVADNIAESSQTISEKFSAYKPYGITYKEENTNSGRGNVYYNNKLVKQFIDVTPTGGVFTYTSKDGGSIKVMTVYDNNDKLSDVQEIK